MKNMHKGRNIKIISTGDGSHTLLVEEMNETYHSTHGALTESLYVFIDKGLKYVAPNKNKIRLLEIGFGTGLNAWLTLRAADQFQVAVHYISLEAYPLEENIYSNLNYTENKEDTDVFLELHRSEWNKDIPLSEYFTLHKEEIRWEDYQSPSSFDLVYYDAFAPSRQSEMWDAELLQKMKSLMAPGGVMVTYCAQGAFKRNLKALDMVVETLPGPPGKAEMVRASL